MGGEDCKCDTWLFESKDGLEQITKRKTLIHSYLKLGRVKATDPVNELQNALRVRLGFLQKMLDTYTSSIPQCYRHELFIAYKGISFVQGALSIAEHSEERVLASVEAGMESLRCIEVELDPSQTRTIRTLPRFFLKL
ncbi:MAG: hypothetical protein SGCHY_000498 [Lobulomycetales sp.]